MAWNWLKRWFGATVADESGGADHSIQIETVDAASNPWHVPVYDVRPVTLGMLSLSQDQECAENLGTFARDDGTGFIGMETPDPRSISAGLHYRIDGTLPDGVLFVPTQMEHKWAIYFHRGQILCIRSWTRQVHVVAEVRLSKGWMEITTLRGTFLCESERPEFTVRVMDFLLRSHVLDIAHPAPLHPGIELDGYKAAVVCMHMFGNRAQFATQHAVTPEPPEQSIRSDSLLHVAVARGDRARVNALLDAGMPMTYLARDGFAPLHWALVTKGTDMLGLLLERGSPVDVRSVQGATPLMNAVQERSVEKTTFLLDHGAAANATDQRGSTALHRAVEMEDLEIARVLLEHGARVDVQAQGHTPRSVAEGRGARAMVELFDRR